MRIVVVFRCGFDLFFSHAKNSNLCSHNNNNIADYPEHCPEEKQAKQDRRQDDLSRNEKEISHSSQPLFQNSKFFRVTQVNCLRFRAQSFS